MSGRINMKVRKSKPKRKDLKYYPGWVWEITGENDEKVIIMPKWDDIKNAIKETIIHELKVDMIIGRPHERARYMSFLTDMIKECQSLQTTIINYANIEPIYRGCKNEDGC